MNTLSRSVEASVFSGFVVLKHTVWGIVRSPLMVKIT